MIWRVIVKYKPAFKDHRGESIFKEGLSAGIKALKNVRTGQAYELSGDLSEKDVRRLAENLLADPITQDAEIASAESSKAPKGVRWAEIWPKTGVADPVAETVKLAASDLGVTSVEKIRSGQLFEFFGGASTEDVESFCENRLMNPLVQRVEVL